MPTVTQSRTIPNVLSGKARIMHTGSTMLQTEAFYGTVQETTSYRSVPSGPIKRRRTEEDERNEGFGGEISRGSLRDEYQRRFDNGHEFSTRKQHTELTWQGGSGTGLTCDAYNSGGVIVRYTGYCYPSYLNIAAYPADPGFPSNNVIVKDGTAAINRTIPTSPEAGLTQFLGELREGLPRLTGTIARRSGLNPKSVSEEYLNREFGQKPFINDLTKFVESMLRANKIVAQYRRDSGRNVRRKTTLRDTSSTSVVGISNGTPMPDRCYGGSYLMWASTPGAQVVDQISSRVWFSGAYTYHLAELDNLFSSLDRYEQLANHLLGTRITPATVWELTPWSWLIDWFSNFGQIVQNVSLLSQDSTVLRYGYVMHETRAVRTRTQVGCVTRGGTKVPPIISRAEIVTKKRTRATPYGFGVNVSTLSPRRWAILGALGMTKGSNSLRLSD